MNLISLINTVINDWKNLLQTARLRLTMIDWKEFICLFLSFYTRGLFHTQADNGAAQNLSINQKIHRRRRRTGVHVLGLPLAVNKARDSVCAMMTAHSGVFSSKLNCPEPNKNPAGWTFTFESHCCRCNTDISALSIV